ncbi:MAG: GNAT family N-acetyltransferase [Pseudomonadales bacterium]|nr:GNAT family N-acetyltransferase [Pseudomonadales bacterium]
MQIRRISLKDDLPALVRDINSARWDDANEITAYKAEDLAYFLQRQDTVFIACYDTAAGHHNLLGIASARIQIKPYDKELWLYIDEVDVCADQRQKGAGKAMMRDLISISRERGCQEVWLGTEVDNIPANALYKSLQPNEIEQFVGYSYRVDEQAGQ